jgi:exo-1,4-beta-D-glucosaminidase
MISRVVVAGSVILGGMIAAWAAQDTLMLSEGWQLQSSAFIDKDGQVLSTEWGGTDNWYLTSVPVTVLAALEESGVYPNLYFGTNLKKVPGYRDGRWLVMQEDSPFFPSWWYRSKFTIPAEFKDKHTLLNFDGINYRANIWLNGQKIGDQEQVIGMFRRFEFPINEVANFGGENILAVEIISPGHLPERQYRTKQIEATTGWDDHNPQPPDLNMGIWQDVYVTTSGPARIEHPFVLSNLDVPSLAVAKLTVSGYVTNVTGAPITATVRGSIGDIAFDQSVDLAAGETKNVVFQPADFTQLIIHNPRVWWPHPVGPQEMYELTMDVVVDGRVSDKTGTPFGIRHATTTINKEGWREYHINGHKILIRGGAWMTTDMLINLSYDRYDGLIRYAREANLNMLRSEGFSIRETNEFYSLCDQHGVMATQQIFGRSIPDEPLAIESIRQMILRIRNHPSLVHFLGHDETFPTPTLDQAYRDMIAELSPDRTYQPHSGAFDVKERFETGGTRTGTRELWTYAGPAHYYTHKDDGAWGFAQSGGVGGIIAPIESVRRMIPEDQLWPLWTEAWSFHTVIQGGEFFNEVLKALDTRYGKPRGVEEFCRKGQALNYECARGMFEAYGRNKYDATGLTTWKYNSAWPAAMTWQYVDWYLIAGGGYYGAKKACQPLHVQYSYDDHSIWVINNFYENKAGLQVEATVYNVDMTQKWRKSASVDVGADGKTQAFWVDWPDGLSKSHFLVLTLKDSTGAPVTDNIYWLSTVPDIPGVVNDSWVNFYTTPESVMDHTDLNALPETALELANVSLKEQGDEMVVTATLTNAGAAMAFQIATAIHQGETGPEVAPTYWSENYSSILPGQSRTVTATFAKRDLDGNAPVMKLEAWNVTPQTTAVK